MANSFISYFRSFIPGYRLIDGGDLQTLVNDIYSYQNGITALAGSGLAGAPVLVNNYNQVDTVATTNDSIALPPATPGFELCINNNGANTLAVFGSYNPANGATDTVLAAGSVGATGAASVTQASGKYTIYSCFKAGVWKQMISG